MPWKPYRIGIRRKVLRILYSARYIRYPELECGHAVRHYGIWHNDPKRKRKRYSCPICGSRVEDMVIPQWRIDQAVDDPQAAILEGKRRRALAHYKEKGEAPPPVLRKVRYRIALYEKQDEAPRWPG